MAGVDPFLHDWDERFHALVAKNMIQEPFKPMLRTNPLFPYDYTEWCCNHVWLHKQPLFLWQMALSMGVFGVDSWSLRLPSVLMGALMLWPVFRMGTLLWDKKTGFYAAFLSVFAGFQLELVSGFQGMDHNDQAFLFYVTLSLWTLMEYFGQGDRPWRWAIATGVFAGMAVLCKWLTGLLVFGVWGVDWLWRLRSDGRWLELRRMLAAFAAACAVFLPWQLYIHRAFPKEAAYEQEFTNRHLFEVLERHGGDWTFYFRHFAEHYGSWMWLAALTGLAALWTGSVGARPRRAVLTALILVYGFFSFIAQTKLTGYVYFSSALVYLLFGLAIRWAVYFFEKKAINQAIMPASAALLLLCGCLTLQPDRIWENHLHPGDPGALALRERKLHNLPILRRINEWVPPGGAVFNFSKTNDFESLEAMFWSDRTAYSWYPAPPDLKDLESRGIPVAVFDHPDGVQAKDYFKADSLVILIREPLMPAK